MHVYVHMYIHTLFHSSLYALPTTNMNNEPQITFEDTEWRSKYVEGCVLNYITGNDTSLHILYIFNASHNRPLITNASLITITFRVYYLARQNAFLPTNPFCSLVFIMTIKLNIIKINTIETHGEIVVLAFGRISYFTEILTITIGLLHPRHVMAKQLF